MTKYECKHLCIAYNHQDRDKINVTKSLSLCLGAICNRCKSHNVCNKCKSMVVKVKCRECVNNLKNLSYDDIRCVNCRRT